MKRFIFIALLAGSVYGQEFFVSTNQSDITTLNTAGLPLGTNTTRTWFQVVPNTNKTAFALEVVPTVKGEWTNKLTKAQYSNTIPNLVLEKNLLTNGWTTNSFKGEVKP